MREAAGTKSDGLVYAMIEDARIMTHISKEKRTA